MDNKLTMKMLIEKLPATERIELPLSGVFEGMTLNVRRTLPLNDAMKFVTDVAASCADVDEGEYTYSAYDFAVRANTIAYYAELKIGKSDMNKLYRLLYETDIYDRVKAVINEKQYDALIDAVWGELEYAREMLTSTAGAKTMEILSQMGEFAAAMETMTEQMRGMDIEGAMDAMLNTIQPPSADEYEEHKVLLMKKPEKTDGGA